MKINKFSYQIILSYNYQVTSSIILLTTESDAYSIVMRLIFPSLYKVTNARVVIWNARWSVIKAGTYWEFMTIRHTTNST